MNNGTGGSHQPGNATPGATKKPGRRKAAGDSAAGGANDNNVGDVLRSVYQKAVDEAIPAEMLDLLSKLD